jgi:hypothetical protein
MTRLGALLWVGGFLMLVAATPNSAAESFSNATLNGSYETLLSVWTSVENVTNQGLLGILTFDGVSKVTGSFTINTGGTITTDTFSGNYAVNSNGTGSITLTDSLGNALDLALVINSDGSNLQLLQTNPNGSTAVMNGTARAQRAGPFSNGSVRGVYGFLEQKFDTTSDPNSSEPDSTLGIITFDGVSKITTSFTDEHKGAIQTTTGSGTYSVNSDGTADASLTLSNGRIVDFVFVLSSSRTFQFLGTNCGCGNAVLSGTAIHQ